MKILKVLLIFLAMFIVFSTPAYAKSDIQEQLPSVVNSVSQTAQESSPPCSKVPGSVSVIVQLPNRPPLQLKAPWTEQATVSLAMNNLEYQNLLQYDTDFSCPYGNLVTSINGVTPSPTQSWFLFINQTLSKVGLDSAILNNNDVVVWKLCPSSGTCSL
ncbi:DUF4430 domain-containing protein [Aphanothece sacrum]|uniref:Transcobalamin-like C-terminal domain-containing protein n=1 Tax=Aphanothece sacrum FPU1 TaxID=1920663 RepID=A0A401IL42_APHSA|nr:DUF4430 domain-containing protein [Aphanothece sacrum]GBF81967.1 hypothetical protein AsFPU1_3390 [Aphanothece sacrum FPU1]GBF83596.1 hypothetical protein AsFPU3_0639 [Aphanothece sacrum FPU3]